MEEIGTMTFLKHTVRKRKAGVSSFTEGKAQVIASNAPTVNLVGETYEVKLHTTTDAVEASQLFPSCIHHCELSDDPLQKCAFYCSALLAFFPDLKPAVMRALNSIGARIVDVVDAESRTLDLVPASSFHVNLCYLGQLILMLFKNISDADYQQYFSDTTYALKAAADLPDTPVNIALRIDSAKVIKGHLGSNHVIRKDVLRAVLSLRDGDESMNRVCKYIAGILAWTDMAPLTFINDMLLVTKSPVIKNLDLMKEVVNLCRALKYVDKYLDRQFFGILGPAHETQYIKRSNFPILAAVAQTLKNRQDSSVIQFHAQAGINTKLVDEFVAQHLAYMAGEQRLHKLDGRIGEQRLQKASTKLAGGRIGGRTLSGGARIGGRTL